MAERDNPFETPQPRGIRVVQGTLRVVVVAQCLGTAAAWLHHRRENPLLQLLGQARDLTSEQLLSAQNGIAAAMIVLAALTLLRPSTFSLLPVIVYQSAWNIAAVLTESGEFPYLQPALRCLLAIVPLALLLIDFWPPRIRPTLILCLSSVSLLRLGTAATFIAHGLFSLWSFPDGSLADLLRNVFQEARGEELPEVLIGPGLATIAAVDFSLALCVVVSRLKTMALLSVVWGFALAASHTLAFGATGYDLTLQSLGSAGAPLAVLLFWVLAVREQKPVYLPDDSDR